MEQYGQAEDGEGGPEEFPAAAPPLAPWKDIPCEKENHRGYLSPVLPAQSRQPVTRPGRMRKGRFQRSAYRHHAPRGKEIVQKVGRENERGPRSHEEQPPQSQSSAVLFPKDMCKQAKGERHSDEDRVETGKYGQAEHHAEDEMPTARRRREDPSLPPCMQKERQHEDEQRRLHPVKAREEDEDGEGDRADEPGPPGVRGRVKRWKIIPAAKRSAACRETQILSIVSGPAEVTR